MTNEQIERLALECGFAKELPDGTMGLRPGVVEFARQVIEHMRQDGWRQCAKGQHTSQNQDAVLIERLHTLAELMRNTADYMLHCPDPAPQHAQELYGAAGVIGKWIDEVEDDGK